MINLKMADGIRLMTLRRGVDPRQFALLSFGGAAGLHAAEVARELEIKRIIVPTVASVLSAWGMLTSDLRYEMSRTHYGAGPRISPTRCANCSANWSRRPPAGCARGSRDRCRSNARPRCATANRFSRSTFRSMVSTGTRPTSSTGSRTAFIASTRNCTPTPRRGQEVVFVNARVAAVGAVAPGDQDTRPASSSGACTPRGKRQAFFGGWREVPVYALERLAAGAFPDRSGHHRGRDHDGAGRHRRPRQRQRARLARYYAALIPTFDFNRAGLRGSVESAGVQWAWRLRPR